MGGVKLLEPKREHRVHAIWAQAMRAPGTEERVPDTRCLVGRHEELESQFPGDPGARDHDPSAVEVSPGEVPALQHRQVGVLDQALQEDTGVRPLDGGECHRGRDVGDIGAARAGMQGHPVADLQPVARTGNDQEMFCFQPKGRFLTFAPSDVNDG